MLCCRYYSERIVSSFDHQIQSEYYGVDRSVSIEGISMEHFSALPDTGMNSSTKSCPRNSVFHYFLLDDSKQDAYTTTSHINCFIELPKERKLLTSSLSKIWGNTDGSEEQYRFSSALYLMSVMLQC